MNTPTVIFDNMSQLTTLACSRLQHQDCFIDDVVIIMDVVSVVASCCYFSRFATAGTTTNTTRTISLPWLVQSGLCSLRLRTSGITVDDLGLAISQLTT